MPRRKENQNQNQVPATVPVPEPLCRICHLLDLTTPKNPLLTPCKCTGSIKYIHYNCLLQWQRVTENEFYKTNCEICNAAWQVPRHWPFEIVLYLQNITPAWLFLRNPLLVFISSYFLYIHTVAYIWFWNQRYRIKAELPNIVSYLYHSNEYNYIYFFILAGVTSLYAIYYWSILRQIRNRYLYLRVFCLNNLFFFLVGLASLYICNYCILPFGYVYIWSLSAYHRSHLITVNAMNRGAFLFQ